MDIRGIIAPVLLTPFTGARQVSPRGTEPSLGGNAAQILKLANRETDSG
jgi:hypothetical protein